MTDLVIRTWLGNTAEMETTTPSLSTDAISGYWSDTTSEVTSIVIAPSSGTIAGASVFELYRRAPTLRTRASTTVR